MVRAACIRLSSMTCKTKSERPGLSAEDVALWRRVTQGDAPLRGRAAAPRPAPKARSADADADAAAEPAPAPPRRRAAQPPPPDAPPASGLDRRTAQRLRRGLIPIDARLDLHGMMQAEARRRVTEAVAAARSRGQRCLLVITGKGEIGGETGVLRQMLPHWLTAPPNAGSVLRCEPARAAHGGAGAWYVLIRKPRGRQ